MYSELVGFFARVSDRLEFIDLFLNFFEQEYTYIVLLFWLVFGLVFGSFLTCLIYRLPRGLSIVSPSSQCPKCSHKLMVPDLVPVFSYLLSRAKCRYCGVKIAPKYLYVELTVAFSALMVFFVMPLSLASLFMFFTCFIFLYALFCWVFERFLSVRALILLLLFIFLTLLLKWHTLFFVIKMSA